MSDTITVKLGKKLVLAGKECSEISFREPKVSDLITIETVAGPGAGQHAITVLMMAQLSGASKDEVAAMAIPDYAACDRALRPFLSVATDGGGGS